MATKWVVDYRFGVEFPWVLLEVLDGCVHYAHPAASRRTFKELAACVRDNDVRTWTITGDALDMLADGPID